MASSSTSIWHFCGSTRLAILSLSVCCVTLIVANSLTLNFSVICMRPLNFSTTDPAHNQSSPPTGPYSPFELGWLFSAIAIGQLVGTPPMTPIISRIGFRHTLTIYGLISALSTLLIPFCVQFGFIVIFILRIAQGVAVAAAWVSQGVITASWSPPQNLGLFLSCLSCSNQLGPVVTMPLAGFMCSSAFGWPGIYFLLGSITLLFFATFYAFYRDSPRDQKNVSPQELCIIERDKKSLKYDEKSDHRIPYKAIFSDLHVWGLLFSFITSTVGLQTLMQYGPVYFNKALGMQVSRTGLAASLPFLLCALIKLFAGPISDKCGCISERAKVATFTNIAHLGMALFYVLLAFLPNFGISHGLIMQICFTGAAICVGFNSIGCFKCAQMIACQFSHVILAIASILMNGAMLLVPLIISLLAPDNTLNQWTVVFTLIAGQLVAGTLFFTFTAGTEPRPWTKQWENWQNAKIGNIRQRI